MASSPSSMSGRRNRPGCMGSISHLFDFNQALAGRKLLTDKKFGTDLERSVSNGGKGRGEASKANSQIDSQKARNAVMTKRINEVPIKALIAEEMSKEPDTKSRTPSVVARLMGLDMMPNDSKNEQRAQRGPGVENVLGGKSQSGTKYPRAPPLRSMSDLSTVSKRTNSVSSSFGLEPQSHFPEPQDRTITEFERWQNWKSESSSQLRALDDLDSHLAAKQLLIKRKLMEAKLGLSPKHSDRQEKLYESKEFMDAIDFLQANKDFFVRFLEQPDPISRTTDFDVSWSEMEHLKHSKSTTKLQTRVKESLRASETDLVYQRKISVNASPFSPTEKYQFDSRISNIVCKAKNNTEQQETPTRIVVLKPGPGKVRNVTPLSHNNPRSSKDFFDTMEVIKENSMDVLQDLRERLQMEDRESLRRTRSCKLPRDPKEIAREIARQVRENVTRDLMANSRSSVSGSHVGFRGRKQYNQFDSEAEGRSSIEKRSQSAKSSPVNRAANNDLNRVLSRLKVPESGNLGRHSVDVTDLLNGQFNGPDASPSQAQFDDKVYHDVHWSLLRSRSVPTSAGGSFNLRTEDSRMQLGEGFTINLDKLVGNVGISDTTVNDVDKSKRAAMSKRGSGMRNSLSRNRKKKGNRQTDKESVSQEVVGSDPLESEKIQCQIDDTGPILDSDSSASSMEAARDVSVSPSAGENESQHIQRCEEVVEDANTSSCSPSTSPRVPGDAAVITTKDGNTKESSEQPSPVSVLDASFLEESSSPMNFNDISSGLQELRSRLQLLRFVDQETMSCQDDEGYFTDENPSTSAPLYLDMSELKLAENDCSLGSGFLLDCLHCPKGKEAEFLYVRNLIVASGFDGDNSAIMTRWHSPSQPLAMCTFDDMEKKYNAGEAKLASDTRRLLFDTVNEVLLDVLGPHVNCRRCWQGPSRSAISVMPTGKLLMQQLWSGVSKLYYAQADGQDTLGNLVAKDLNGKDRWCNFDCEVEFVMLEVERSIFNDLIQETLMVI